MAPLWARPACGGRYLCDDPVVGHVIDRTDLVVRLVSHRFLQPLRWSEPRFLSPAIIFGFAGFSERRHMGRIRRNNRIVLLPPPVERCLAIVSGRKRPWKWFHAPSPAGNGRGSSSTPRRWPEMFRGTGSKPWRRLREALEPVSNRGAAQKCPLEVVPNLGAGCAALWKWFQTPFPGVAALWK